MNEFVPQARQADPVVEAFEKVVRESSPDPSYEGPHTLKSLKEQWHANLEWVKYHDSRRHLHPGSRTARKKYKETMTAIEDMVKDGQYQAPEE